MKKLKLIYAMACAALVLTSCDDFLNTMPDSRAEVNTDAKVSALLVSAYPNKVPIFMMEFSTDNVMDNGLQYYTDKRQEEVYFWEEITIGDNDCPKFVWQAHYSAIAAANQALQAIDDMGNPDRLAPQRAEALMCRAYSHFVLADIFCLPYNPETADKDMGLPYSEKPETQVLVKYERGTMAELYKKINDDIEAALPDIRDDAYTVPKYHFNKKASYAFAARFNLLYTKADKSNYQKVIDYASVVLGSMPEKAVRKMSEYLPLGKIDFGNAYVQADEVANLLFIPAVSTFIRATPRYNHNKELIMNETFRAYGPWKSSGSSGFLVAPLYGSNQSAYFPKFIEFWEMIDKTGGIGFLHLVHVPFTGDETLLCRAEAYTLQERYEEAATDLNIWQEAHCRQTYTDNGGTTYTLDVLTREAINEFFSALPYAPIPIYPGKGESDRSIKKTLHPQGFTVNEGEQENFIQCVLHLRRIENMHTGLRWVDIKRYGIEVEHNRDGFSSEILKANDLRHAIQLPTDVIDAGMTANPR